MKLHILWGRVLILIAIIVILLAVFFGPPVYGQTKDADSLLYNKYKADIIQLESSILVGDKNVNDIDAQLNQRRGKLNYIFTLYQGELNKITTATLKKEKIDSTLFKKYESDYLDLQRGLPQLEISLKLEKEKLEQNKGMFEYIQSELAILEQRFIKKKAEASQNKSK